MKKINLGNNLYTLRKRRGLSQEEFAEKIHISRQAVSKWERGEALPDTENLIEIAEFYGVTLDELVNSTEPLDTAEASGKAADGHAPTVKIITFDDESSTVHIEDEAGTPRKKVIIGAGGVEVITDDDEDRDEDEDTDDDDGENSGHRVTVTFHPAFNIAESLPYPIIVTIAYLLLGFFVPNGWAVYWTLFITIPIYYTVVECIKKRRFSPFAYPVLCAFVFCFIGMLLGIWHPTWIIFISIPVYYAIAGAIDRHIARKRGESVYVADDDDDDDDDDD